VLEAGVQQQRSQASANDQIATDGFERVFNDQAGEPHWWWSVELKRIGKYIATGLVGAGAKLMHEYSIASCW
jgi:hypothetical protein